jgi:hypothetical protein
VIEFPMKVWAVIDDNGGADALYGIFMTEAQAVAHVEILEDGERFHVEMAEVFDGPMTFGVNQ